MFTGLHRCRHCTRPHVFTIYSRGAFAIHDTIIILYVHYIHLHGRRLLVCYTHPLCNLVIVNSNIIIYYYYNERQCFQTSRVRYSCTAAPPDHRPCTTCTWYYTTNHHLRNNTTYASSSIIHLCTTTTVIGVSKLHPRKRSQKYFHGA